MRSALRHAMRWAVAVALHRTGILAARRWWRLLSSGGHGVIILRYHRVKPDASADPFHLSVSPRVFDAQVRYLKSHYDIVPIEQLLTAPPDGDTAGRRARVCITFDDGYRDNFTHALPVLEHQSAPFAVFVTTNPMEHGTPFWWDELESLVRAAPQTTLRVTWLEGESQARERGSACGPKVVDGRRSRAWRSSATPCPTRTRSAYSRRCGANWGPRRRRA